LIYQDVSNSECNYWLTARPRKPAIFSTHRRRHNQLLLMEAEGFQK